MQGTDQQSGLDWKDGVPIARRFDDPYFSLQDGLAETQHVFLAGNELPHRFRDGFQIAELGFGTGLNLLASCSAWVESGVPGRLNYSSFEAFPISKDEMAEALTAFPQLSEIANNLVNHWSPESARFTLMGCVDVEIIVGDARETLLNWRSLADAWFLDGFSPAKNPELWEPELMHLVGARTHPKGTFATYTAAGHVRRALGAAGFDVTRKPGFGRKRHMSVGVLKPIE